MKKSISFLLCLVLIFSSFSFCFAAATDWSTTDSTNLQNAANRLYYNNNSAAYYLYNIATNTNNIYNKCVDIYNALFYENHNITYWVNAISTWMSPIYNAITSVPTDLFTIIGALGYTDSNNTYHPYLNEYLTYYTQTGLEGNTVNGRVTTYSVNGDGAYNGTTSVNVSNFNALSSIIYWLFRQQNNDVLMHRYAQNHLYDNVNTNGFIYSYNSTQNALNWGNLSTSSFTPVSSIDGTYKWLSAIQAPVARLSYVLANDQEIEARDYAAANQEAVVDNFIDSSGDGAASTSDFESIADFSSGYQSTFSSDASPTGIFNLFTSDNMSWFSQETYNQLDTTSSNNRAKFDNTFNTPLLDQQINSIYEQLGVKQP